MISGTEVQSRDDPRICHLIISIFSPLIYYKGIGVTQMFYALQDVRKRLKIGGRGSKVKETKPQTILKNSRPLYGLAYKRNEFLLMCLRGEEKIIKEGLVTCDYFKLQIQ